MCLQRNVTRIADEITRLVRGAHVAAGGIELRDVGAPPQWGVRIAPRLRVRLYHIVWFKTYRQLDKNVYLI